MRPGLWIIFTALLFLIVIIMAVYRKRVKWFFCGPTMAETFADVWDPPHRRLIVKTLEDVGDILDSMRVDWFIACGTLLGAARHQGFIPWDDDVDIFVDSAVLKPDMWSIFSRELMEKGCTLQNCIKGKEQFDLYKVYHKDADAIPGKSWKWPFVDLFFFERDGDHIKLYDSIHPPNNATFPRDVILPTKRVPFENIPNGVSVPNNMDAVLKADYGSDYMTTCVSSEFCHKLEEYYDRPKLVANCDIVLNKINLDRR